MRAHGKRIYSLRLRYNPTGCESVSRTVSCASSNLAHPLNILKYSRSKHHKTMILKTKNSVNLKKTVDCIKRNNQELDILKDNCKTLWCDSPEIEAIQEEGRILKKDLVDNLPESIQHFITLPSIDKSGKIDLMRYCSHNLSYGISFELVELPNVNKITYHLCTSPLLSSVIIEVLASFESFEEMREAFYKQREYC